MVKEQKENLVFITDFEEKISLFLPGFDVDIGELTAEQVVDIIRRSCRGRPGWGLHQWSSVQSPFLSFITKVSETGRDGNDPSGSGRSSRDGDDLWEGGSHSLPEILERVDGKQESLRAKRCLDVCTELIRHKIGNDSQIKCF